MVDSLEGHWVGDGPLGRGLEVERSPGMWTVTNRDGLQLRVPRGDSRGGGRRMSVGTDDGAISSQEEGRLSPRRGG